MIKGHTYDKQLYNSVAHRLLNREFLDNENGILNQGSKCGMTYTTNSITVNDGFIVIQGGITEIEYSDTINVELDDSYCRLVYELDLSKVNDESNFNQGKLKIISSSSGYPSLTQQVLTENSGVYQFELAQFKAATAGITNFVDKRTYLRSGDTLDSLKTALGLGTNTYDNSVTYAVGDMVIYNSCIYKCLQASTGKLPTNTTYWQLVSFVETENNNIKINDELNETTYSMQEREIGVYIDSNNTKHKLYQITLAGSAASGDAIRSNWSYHIIDMSGIVEYYDGSYVFGNANTSYHMGVYGNLTSGNLRVYHTFSGQATYRITIKYIKN